MQLVQSREMRVILIKELLLYECLVLVKETKRK